MMKSVSSPSMDYQGGRTTMNDEDDADCIKNLQRVRSWDLLPEDIFFEIISRLPLKSVMKCRCVCKSWNSSLSSPHFIRLHLSRAPQSGNPDIVFSTTDFIVDDNPNYTKPKVSLRKNLYLVQNLGVEEEEVVTPLSLPPHLTRLDIVGSCNGLLCLSESSYETLTITVYVCNPFTAQTIQLPSSTSIPFKPEHCMFGFGYDPIRLHYKVLRLVFHSLKTCLADCKVEAEICTLGGGAAAASPPSWRRIGEAPFTPFGPGCCVHLDGVIHCVANCNHDWDNVGIGFFDVGDETLRFEPLIPQMLPVWNENIDISVLGGCLSVVNYSSLDYAEIWILTYSGEDDDDWTFLFALPISDIVTLHLVCLLNNGEILFLSNNEELLSCHPFGDDARELGLYGMSETIHSFTHLGTLVSPVTSTGFEE